MGVWERLNNPSFNVTEFRNIRNESGGNGFVLSTKRWVEQTNAVGIYSRAGRYNSGTFAHKDISFEFASWISVEFKLYLIKEFQRLKDQELKLLGNYSGPRCSSRYASAGRRVLPPRPSIQPGATRGAAGVYRGARLRYSTSVMEVVVGGT